MHNLCFRQDPEIEVGHGKRSLVRRESARLQGFIRSFKRSSSNSSSNIQGNNSSSNAPKRSQSFNIGSSSNIQCGNYYRIEYKKNPKQQQQQQPQQQPLVMSKSQPTLAHDENKVRLFRQQHQIQQQQQQQQQYQQQQQQTVRPTPMRPLVSSANSFPLHISPAPIQQQQQNQQQQNNFPGSAFRPTMAPNSCSRARGLRRSASSVSSSSFSQQFNNYHQPFHQRWEGLYLSYIKSWILLLYGYEERYGWGCFIVSVEVQGTLIRIDWLWSNLNIRVVCGLELFTVGLFCVQEILWYMILFHALSW